MLSLADCLLDNLGVLLIKVVEDTVRNFSEEGLKALGSGPELSDHGDLEFFSLVLHVV